MLLMSSDVQAKCTNSAAGPKPIPASFSFRKYSTALTSWLIARSMSLIRVTSAGPKSTTQPLSTAAVSGGIGASSTMSGSAARSSSHSTSTAKR